MTKAERIEHVAKEAGISRAAANKALDSFIDGIKKALKKKDGEGRLFHDSFTLSLTL
jgi:DNA-binding protein HU-beta